MTALQRYNLVPRAPLMTPISAHPPAAPCPPGASFPEGEYISRGGVFEGAQMAADDSHCGTFSDHTGKVPLRTWPMVAPNGVPIGARVAAVPGWPPETRVGFMPRDMTLGFPDFTYDMERPTDAISMAGFGHISAPGVSPGMQLMDPMRLIDNRSQSVWTGPLTAQADWPEGSTPRGGVLDGNTLNIRGQSPTSAFYYGASPEVMLPPNQINVLPNPINQEPVPQVGWGVSGALGEYVPAGASQASRPTSPRPAQFPELTPRHFPKAVSSSIFGGQVPGGGIIGRSVFTTPVYERRAGDMPAQMTVEPTGLAVPATEQAAALMGFGQVGPDGLGV